MTRPNHFGFEKDEIRAFTEGDCWALALALHELTGWQLVAIGYSDEHSRPLGQRSWDHVGVRRPDGMVVDITGVHDAQAWLASWHHPAYGAVFETEVHHLMGFERVYSPVPLLCAKEIISQLAVAPAAALA